MKIAIIGAGFMGKEHVKGWKLAGHDVVSITDIDTVQTKKLAEEFKVAKTFVNYKEAIVNDEVDIVSVCLPLAFHAPVTIFAAEQGKHIFCEKPIARSFEEVEEMVKAVNKAGVQFGLGFQRNFANAVLQLKQWAGEGKFGHPLVFTSDLLQEVRPKRVMHDADGNMGPIVDACCHDFLMWQTVFQSKPKTVYARGGILAKDRPEIAHFEKLAIDTGAIVVEYESGDIGTMTVSWGMAKGFKMKTRPDRLYGPEGGTEGKANVVTDKIALYVGNEEMEVKIEKQNLHQDQFEAFVDALEQSKPAPVSFQTGKDMLRLSLAILESIESGKVIAL